MHAEESRRHRATAPLSTRPMFGLFIEKFWNLEVAHEGVELDDRGIRWRVDDDDGFEDGREAFYEETILPFVV